MARTAIAGMTAIPVVPAVTMNHPHERIPMKMYTVLWEDGRRIIGLYRERSAAEMAAMDHADNGYPRLDRNYRWYQDRLWRWTKSEGNISLPYKIQEWDL